MTDSPVQAVRETRQRVIIETPRLILRAARASDAIPLHEAFRDPEVMRYWSTPPHVSIEQTQSWLHSMISSPQNGLTDFIITLKQPDSAFHPLSASIISSPKIEAASQTTEQFSIPYPTPIAIGKIGIYRPLPSNEIGFLLSRTYWGCGLAKEAIDHILEYLFSLSLLPTSASATIDSSQSAPVPSDHANEVLSPSTDTTTNTNDEPPQPHNYTTLTPDEQQKSIYRYPSISADVDPRNAASRGILTHSGFVDVGLVERTDFIGGEWVDSVYLRCEGEAWVRNRGSGTR